MRASEFIVEIGAAHGVGKMQKSDSEIIAGASVIDDFDTRDVWLYQDEFQQIYFFSDGKTIDAFVCLVGNAVRGIRNLAKTPGLITALMLFLVKERGLKLQINDDEDLTPDGLAWVTSIIQAGGRGMKITDQNGQTPTGKDLQDEWNKYSTSYGHGPTSIFFESSDCIPQFKRNADDPIIMRTTKIIGDRNLL